MKTFALLALALASSSIPIHLIGQPLTVIVPEYYDRALRNPLKGFTHNIDHEWGTLSHRYIRWNELEYQESDGLERILLVSNQKFTGGANKNVKFIPRVYLHWDAAHEKHWPVDMTPDDYTSEQFQARVVRLIERLGIAWNNDPLVGEAFKRAFPARFGRVFTHGGYRRTACRFLRHQRGFSHFLL